jgi:indoleamine 2,3-dioxygenase
MQSLRAYIPPRHRAFIEQVGTRVEVRRFIVERRPAEAVLAYDACIAAMHAFRELHLRYAAAYVHRQGQISDSNSTETGTGGTPFMSYLKRHLDNVAGHRIS